METEKVNKNPAIPFLAIVLAIIVFAAIGTKMFISRSTNLVGKMAPPIQIDDWITQPPRQSDLDGQVYVIEFWATWCQPCVQSIPHTIKLAAKYKKKSVSFIALSTDRSSEPVKKMVKNKRINYYVAMATLSARREYSVGSIPKAFVINRSGKVVWQGHPMNSDFEPAIIKALKAPPLVPDTK